MLSNFQTIFGGEEADLLDEDVVDTSEVLMPTTTEEVEEMAAEKQADDAVEEVEDQAEQDLEPVVEAVAETEDAIEEAVEIVEAIDGEVIDPITTEEVVIEGAERLDGLMSGNYNAAAMKYVYSRMQRVAPKLGVDLENHTGLDGTESFNDVYMIKDRIIAGKEGLIQGIKRFGSRTWDLIKRVMSSIFNFFVRIFSSKKDVAVYYNATMQRLAQSNVKAQAKVGDWETYIDPNNANKCLDAWLGFDNEVSSFVAENIAVGKKIEAALRAGKRPDGGILSRATKGIGNLFKFGFKGKYTADSGRTEIAGMLLTISTSQARTSRRTQSMGVRLIRNPNFVSQRGALYVPKVTISELSSGLKLVGRYVTDKKNEQYAKDFSPSAVNQTISALQARFQTQNPVGEEGHVSDGIGWLKTTYTNIGTLTAGILPAVMKGVTSYMNFVNSVIVKSK